MSDLFAHIRAAGEAVSAQLLARRNDYGHWTGELSSSALSTATAVCALAVVAREGSLRDPRGVELIHRGLEWLVQNANADGGWGDTALSFSNISTTAVAWAAFGAVTGADENYRATVAAAEQWLMAHTGALTSERIADAIIARYGRDRTFAVPILTACALAGRLGKGRVAWRRVMSLPFELAACPPRWFAALRLPVVSYALPALIAVGQARHYHRPTWNPLTRLARHLTRRRTLDLLGRIQPASGGFLEATPLTSFVTMSLAGSGQGAHPVVQNGAAFLVSSARPDGSWPIDTNLATWLTTLAINALAGSGGSTRLAERLRPEERRTIRGWLLRQQHRVEHRYTRAAPGGWAWTDLPGGVPDADDTAGALLALHHLGDVDDEVRAAASAGIRWLLDLQNRDGGLPTFCRGWTNLPFDRSGPDLTAHAVRAWLAWRDELPPELRQRLESGTTHALRYLNHTMRADGTWAPLWFGNQHHPAQENPTCGTARVVVALSRALASGYTQAGLRLFEGTRALLRLQQTDGGWGGGADTPPSVEETALAVQALAGVLRAEVMRKRAGELQVAVERGAQWLVERWTPGAEPTPTPIGFYFAKLWYYEGFYPLIFSAGALGEAATLFEDRLGTMMG